ncbi:MAG: hypothetical protein RIR70_1282 [Pseudomonadota bacterium]|jgi:type III pantothenate kinase
MLLFDAGNTRLKWGIKQGDAWLAQGVLDYDSLEEWPAHWPTNWPQDWAPTHSPAIAFGVNVAGPNRGALIEKALAQAGLATHFFKAEAARCGLTNLYREPAQLGADRFAALIGARALHPGPLLVVCAGTATTIDHVDAEGYFQGGLILPGLQMMRESLAHGTAGLPLATGPFVDWPRSTDEAIMAGCLAAQVGAVMQMWQRLPDTPDRLCLLCGGAAASLVMQMPQPCRQVPDLVLQGVAQLATQWVAEQIGASRGMR